MRSSRYSAGGSVFCSAVRSPGSAASDSHAASSFLKIGSSVVLSRGRPSSFPSRSSAVRPSSASPRRLLAALSWSRSISRQPR